MIASFIESIKPIAKAWVGVAVTAASPFVIAWVQEAGNNLVVGVVGVVTAFLGGLAVWAVPNKG